jgi:hypothetical protein
LKEELKSPNCLLLPRGCDSQDISTAKMLNIDGLQSGYLQLSLRL